MKITYKKREKGLKNASFWIINLPPAATLFAGQNLQEGGVIEMDKKNNKHFQNVEGDPRFFIKWICQ